MPQRILVAFLVSAVCSFAFGSSRSAAVISEFKRTHPCPATGHTRGACPGWEIDHSMPLKCGGADTADNMQWLSVAQHKIKTKSEMKLCRKKSLTH